MSMYDQQQTFWRAHVVAEIRGLQAGAEVAVRMHGNEVQVMAATPNTLSLTEAQTHIKTVRPLTPNHQARLEFERWYNGD